MTMNLKYLYGPVASWRLGRSLGVDVLSQGEKICNFDCIYCQLGKTGYCPARRREFVGSEEVIKEFAGLPAMHIDYITFSGRGEATLASNLSAVLDGIRKLSNKPAAIITNAALMCDAAVRKELLAFDFVVAKLDACNDEMLSAISRPVSEIRLSSIIDGLCTFKKEYCGRLAVQTMLIEQNARHILSFADIYARIQPDEIQLNTPLRPCTVAPLSVDEVRRLSGQLTCRLPHIAVKTVYESEKPDVEALSEPDTLKRRGKI